MWSTLGETEDCESFRENSESSIDGEDLEERLRILRQQDSEENETINFNNEKNRCQLTRSKKIWLVIACCIFAIVFGFIIYYAIPANTDPSLAIGNMIEPYSN